MKVLVTGSREWTDEEIIRREVSLLPPGTIQWGGTMDCIQRAEDSGILVKVVSP